jgi:hypothetical protein
VAPPPLVALGERYGSLTVLWLETKRRRRNRVYRCRCDCGERVSVTSIDLRQANVRSCGCRRVEVARRLGREHGARNIALVNAR